MLRHLLCAAMACLAMSLASQGAEPNRQVVIFDGAATPVSSFSEPSKDLWVTVADLKRATGYVIKPQGVCRDQLCFPIPKAKKASFIAKRASTTWFNLSEFARLVGQAVAYDNKNGV